MPTEALISIETFCMHHHAELSFVQALQACGLIETITVEQSVFIHEDQLETLEMLARLRQDLDINMEGIEAIMHLREQVKTLQQENWSLQNRLRLYETRDNSFIQ